MKAGRKAAKVAFDSRHPEPMQRDDDAEGHALEEKVGEIEKGYGMTERRMAAGKALKQLKPRDRDLMAERIGCSQMQVSRRLKHVLEYLNSMTRQPGERESQTAR